MALITGYRLFKYHDEHRESICRLRRDASASVLNVSIVAGPFLRKNAPGEVDKYIHVSARLKAEREEIQLAMGMTSL